MKNEFLGFIENLQQIYLENHDMDNILALIDKDASWIGTGKYEICRNFSEATTALLLERTEYDQGFTVTDSWYEMKMISDDACVVYGEFWATPKDITADVAELHHRISAVCAKKNGEIKLLHLHMSIPDGDLEQGEYFAKGKKRVDAQTLRIRYAQASRELQSRSQELEALTANIPGGAHKCKNDSAFTIVSMSSGFLSMFGYSKDEIQTIFNNSFVSMIHEDDRASVAATMEEQLSHDTTVEFEYRVPCKDGSIMWVLDRGKLVMGDDGSEYFFCIMMDITMRKVEDEKLRLALERHKVIMNQATDIIFEWDMLSDTIDFSSNWEKRFGYPPISAQISNKIPLSENIHPEDIPSFIKIMTDTSSGVPYCETEFRIRRVTGIYMWCRIRATTQFNSCGVPIKAIGVIVDIDDEKNRSSALFEAAQRDALTQLYNKIATKSLIEKKLAEKNDGSFHALMIIDVDNFKSINDRFGHQFGDAVLLNMAKALKKLFRSSDVVGRVGGDEFLVFMSSVNDKELVAAKAREIVCIFADMPGEIDGNLSCSVGVSFYPLDGKDYSSLVHCADKALYMVKHSGKVNFAFYDKALCNDAPAVSMRTQIAKAYDDDNNEIAPIDQTLTRYIFEVLYVSTDLEVAINHILQKVGCAYNVSRAYIFEASDDGKFCSNTFEWCNDGIEPQMQDLQNLSFETDLEGFFDIYDENDVFYCQDIGSLNPQLRSVLEQQDITSVLQCFIKDGGKFKGYMGFDECGKNRYWTKEQVDTLSIAARILSTFLVKQRLNEQLQKYIKLSTD